MAYRTNTEELIFVAARIGRLEATITRMEQLGLSSSSAGGISRNFMDYGAINSQLIRAKNRYAELQSIISGCPMDPTVKLGVVSAN